jgi:Domain of unknown function (DUF4835)
MIIHSMKYLKILSLLFVLAFSANAQELNCVVTLNSDQLYAQQNTDANAMNQLKAAITDFMNSRRWTNDNYAPEEKIKCKLNINLLRSPSQGNYEGNVQVIVTRPVFGTGYETITFSYIDRFFNFGFLPGNPMFFNENSYSDELTHSLAYYAYIILASDYDTFSKQGGTPYIQKAFNLANIAQTASASPAWKSSGDTRNRYWLTENLMNQQMMAFREGLYNYHRLGLDTFAENSVLARKQVIEMLNTIRTVNQLKPAAVLINSFFDAKGEEIYKILREASKDERLKAFTTLSMLDPAKTEMYRKLMQ